MSNYPFSGFLPRSLNPEDHVDIEGYIPDGARGFSVNLICDNQNDIAYHFKADFENGMVVINCKFNGMWQEEQTSGDLLFQRGYPFRLKLRISNGEIYTYCEEIFLNQFRLLHPIESAKFIQVWGDIERVTKLSFTYG